MIKLLTTAFDLVRPGYYLYDVRWSAMRTIKGIFAATFSRDARNHKTLNYAIIKESPANWYEDN